MEYIRINENGIHIVFGITEEQQLKLLHFSSVEYKEEELCKLKPECKEEDVTRWPQYIKEGFQLVQVNVAGYNRPYEKHGNKHIVTAPGYLLTYVGMEDSVNETGRVLLITQEDTKVTGIRVITTMQFYKGTSIVRCSNKVINIGEKEQTLEYISSFCYTGIEKEGEALSDEKMALWIPFNGWQKEMSFRKFSFADFGMAQTQPTITQRTSQVLEITNTGNWSAKKYLPMGYLENTQAHTSLFWQIEHNGSWHYEIGDQNNNFYLTVSGPTELQSQWFKNLKAGETFESVPVAVGVATDNFGAAMGELTKYRRMIRRQNRDDETLPVIFNDYMNCLFGDPTTEKELPLIDAAAECGCEYYVIDAGWYAPGEWWDSVGEWQECKERFPNGIKEVTDYIRSKGMVAGVWLELEVMGIECELAKKVPDDWFFMRHGRRVYDRSRYQLDFRNPAVIAHANEVIDRVVNEYGVGYIKMDYNIEPGTGTEVGADSVGQGLLEHERAYLQWLDEVFKRYPDLVIENCSSGGLRIDYALLSRYSIQSTSDQEDYRNYATIAANAIAGVTPEQAAVWSYPMKHADKEEVIYNMINAMLLRIHQSGHLAELSEENRDLVKEGIACYKSMRSTICEALPFWPNGLADNLDPWLCAGIYTEEKAYLAVWRRGSSNREWTMSLQDLEQKTGKQVTGVTCIYPIQEETKYSYDPKTAELKVCFEKEVMARLFEVQY
ncbi:glycoside hydrolase family 36 protein [Anaerosporobacter faecicola]|uniref:glycoside hydrolase family 36 protein n=1 Tax=Anaerosporobacter faecicola TaxID=2718714 RepID=UPI0014396839|nr:glycoside hydrolase family 36 protein [Anaerosporobacter faecicola]